MRSRRLTGSIELRPEKRGTNFYEGECIMASAFGSEIAAPAAPSQRPRRPAAAIGEDAASELSAVFAALDPLELEAEQLRVSSRSAAARQEREIEEEAGRIMVEARAQADSQRDDVVTARLRAADVKADAIVAKAEVDAERIRAAGEQRLPGFVADVLARVLEVGS
jgi:vacuolar-type H+-ATPase subunit H